MKCPKCNSENVKVEIMSETKTVKHGRLENLDPTLGCLMYIVLFVLTMGLILLFPLTYSENVTETYKGAICQSCGYSWKIPEHGEIFK